MEEKKALWRAPVQWPSARDGGRRIGANADLGWPTGTLSFSARSILPSRGGWRGGRRGGRRIELLLFALPLAVPRGSWRNGRMPSPYGTAPTPARVARSEAERAEGGTSGTLVTEILGAPQRETVKEKLVKCVLAPRFSSAPAPRESTAKSAPHPAAPVGKSP